MNDVIEELLIKVGLQNAHWDLQSERVVRIETQDGLFALKRWERTPQEREHFLHHLRYAERAGMKGIIPLTNRRGDMSMFETNRHYFYLEPWIEEQPLMSPPPKELRLLTILALNHKISEDEEDMTEDELSTYKNEVQQGWQQDQLLMNQLADQFEHSRFMSPFELTFLNGYPFYDMMFGEMKKGFQKWTRQVKEREGYRFAFCHGRPSLEHGLIAADGNAWFTNWETSGPGHPAYDLAYFYQDLARHEPFDPLESKQLFGTYEAYGPSWGEADTGLLKALMLTPAPILTFARAYATDPLRYAEHQWTAMLESKLSSLRYLLQMMQWKEKQEAAMQGS
ncbi:phosphotransferase [Salicibibacter cibarius]|uniref:Phosphotransferase n=1 Tax=Salicibibacter cibarius TaxID=2743000 RepID=A0A7T6Z5D5_9BACI|nr:phosphotransferase [Salicibibacter cibarius]QQK77123.1 phosphotransferase [Salicibibacter cibarius]